MVFIPAFGLNIDIVQPKPIFLYDTVDALVARFANDHFRKFVERTSIAHCQQQFHDQRFKERRRLVAYLVKQFLRQRLFDLLESILYSFFWRLVCCMVFGFNIR